MDEDLKLGFHIELWKKTKIERKILHASAWGRRSGMWEFHIQHRTERTVENWRNTIFRWNLIFFCLKITWVSSSSLCIISPCESIWEYHHWHKSLFNKKFTLKWISRRFMNASSPNATALCHVWKIGCFMKMKHVMLQLWRFQFLQD